MAHEHETFSRPSGGAFLAGLLMGAAVGAGLALLFAPKTGRELRQQLAESARRARESARDAYQQATEKVSETAAKAAGEVKQALREVVSGSRGAQS